MAFRVGQKVVCVDDGPSILGRLTGLVTGAVYTVTAVGLTHPIDAQRLPCIEIAERDSPNAFWAHRFRPIVERKTDISIFTAMLDKTPERVG